MNKDNTDYEIDRELTGKWAIESNAELQEKYFDLRKKYRRLQKEHNKLQVEHSRLLFDKDAVIEHEVDVKCKKIIKENKKLKETIKDHQLYEEKLEHRIIEFEELLHGE